MVIGDRETGSLLVRVATSVGARSPRSTSIHTQVSIRKPMDRARRWRLCSLSSGLLWHQPPKSPLRHQGGYGKDPPSLRVHSGDPARRQAGRFARDCARSQFLRLPLRRGQERDVDCGPILLRLLFSFLSNPDNLILSDNTYFAKTCHVPGFHRARTRLFRGSAMIFIWLRSNTLVALRIIRRAFPGRWPPRW